MAATLNVYKMISSKVCSRFRPNAIPVFSSIVNISNTVSIVGEHS